MSTHLDIVAHYEACLAAHGDTHRGVDWPNPKDAATRYDVMLGVIREAPRKVSLLDFGCGASHLLEHLQRSGETDIAYAGLDLSSKFIQLSQSKHPRVPYYCLDILEEPATLPIFDYIVLNGVFTEKRSLSHEDMLAYFQRMLRALFAKARCGIAFNVMSKHVDWEREDLFHLSLDVLAAFLKRELSRHYVIRNDYGLYEYAVYVYQQPAGR